MMVVEIILSSDSAKSYIQLVMSLLQSYLSECLLLL